jgi:SpoVK/Ycf46/Vps4 family AAA+-type ATPase
MPDSLLSIDEEDALKAILAHHRVKVTRSMVADLSVLIDWVRDCERTKGTFSHSDKSPLLLTVLSKMGIFGKEIVAKVPVKK